jgi:hypothetical protein
MSECEPIKILRENLAYIPKQTRRASLLTRAKPYSYRKTIGPRNRISQPRNTAEERQLMQAKAMRDHDNQN